MYSRWVRTYVTPTAQPQTSEWLHLVYVRMWMNAWLDQTSASINITNVSTLLEGTGSQHYFHRYNFYLFQHFEARSDLKPLNLTEIWMVGSTMKCAQRDRLKFFVYSRCNRISCPKGYDFRDGSCFDQDECKVDGVCGTGGRCINTVGTYYCR